MKKILLFGIVSTIALAPAAYAAQPAQTNAGRSASVSTANFDRGDNRKGEWVRGQGRINRDDSAGRSQRSAQDGQRGARREERRENWNQSQNQQQGQQWNRGEERRRGEDSTRRDNDGRNWNRGDDDRRWSNNDRYDRRDNDRWDRGWRNDRRYDWRGHRERYRSYYRPGRYYAPNRYDRYRWFSIGIYLGSPFYSNRYWIADPWYYRLPPAHGPYRWVRYYDDVLLIDVRNGYVVDVIHDFFW
ncbi:RcnB family protein [Sphingorhabdus sp.]|jgi:hypothetical protein|uniref:RcnB family protein n=1 Tax=Sphingorhabdus sp. TaxID=1902408 RepID=UPI002BBB87C2|nr:RcnB family protein [Sphingorhabdus sp.]HMT42021.1 RcnB family protein [Sphingorhabdus sp.]